jgi:hypothetical protein
MYCYGAFYPCENLIVHNNYIFQTKLSLRAFFVGRKQCKQKVMLGTLYELVMSVGDYR